MSEKACKPQQLAVPIRIGILTERAQTLCPVVTNKVYKLVTFKIYILSKKNSIDLGELSYGKCYSVLFTSDISSSWN